MFENSGAHILYEARTPLKVDKRRRKARLVHTAIRARRIVVVWVLSWLCQVLSAAGWSLRSGRSLGAGSTGTGLGCMACTPFLRDSSLGIGVLGWAQVVGAQLCGRRTLGNSVMELADAAWC